MGSPATPSLRIGMVAPPWFSVPPESYGGTESVVAGLVDGLVGRGHHVELIGAGPPLTTANRFLSVFESPPSAQLGYSSLPEVIMAAEVARAFRDPELDLVHDHSLAGPLLAAGRRIPTVITMHNPATGGHGDYLARLGRSIAIVAISDAQRSLAPHLNWVGTVHNAIDVSSYPYSAEKDDVLLWMGRYCRDKAPHLAIEAARAVGKPIILAGRLNEKTEVEYFAEMVKPRLGPDVECIGEVDGEQKRALFARCACLVFPIQWDEPFGMVMVEAMACGTPVVVTRRGSAPEVVDDGHTGVLVDHAGQLPAAIEQALTLDPLACRHRARRMFDLPVMAVGYERIYRLLLEGVQPIRQFSRRGTGSVLD